MEENTNRAEAERLLGIADKLLRGKDLSGSRDFAILAQETEALLEGPDQILAVTDVLIAAEKRINNHHDWYSILQIDRRDNPIPNLDLIKRQYRRFALLLHPDKNKFAFADTAFKLVADAWAVLSEPSKKALYDNELSLYSRIDLVAMRNQFRQHKEQQDEEQQQQQQQQQHQHQKLPVRRNSRGGENLNFVVGGATNKKSNNNNNNNNDEPSRLSSFWTACPYCYNLFQYPRVYEDCCLRCDNCKRSFHAAKIPSLPPLVPGKEAYYCCWGFFPLGFVNSEGGKGKNYSAFPNWMPPMYPTAATEANGGGGGDGDGDGFVDVPEGDATPVATTDSKKRGRPKKNL